VTDSASPDSAAASDRSRGARLDSWKEIAAYLRRDVTTVQRWERREGMPVHRHLHDKMGTVYAFAPDLDAWARTRHGGQAAEGGERDLDRTDKLSAALGGATAARPPTVRGRLGIWLVIGVVVLSAAGLTIWLMNRRDTSSQNVLAGARFVPLTDFPGNEQAAAVSRDGNFGALLSDRDGRMDLRVTQVGTGQFYNLTRSVALELVNTSIRQIGFSPDGTLATFWTRRFDGSQSDISVWAVPVLGGAPKPYLEGAAEFDWSRDGTRLVYHTPGPGDPLFVRDDAQSEPRHIFSAPTGLHGHFPVWSPDHAFIYFVQGAVPDGMDIWRINAGGGTAERITHHDSRVSHPVFLDARTLMYLASDPDGSGPWLHSLDVNRRESHRVSFGLERYTSLAASADGQHLAATVANQNGAFWRMTLAGSPLESSAPRAVSLTTRTGSSPRLGAGYLLYVSSKGESDSIWKLEGDVATELWSAPEERIVGAPVVARDGQRIAFATRRNQQTFLYVANADGTNAHIVTRSLELKGAPAWSPNGQSLTVAAMVDGTPRLFHVPLDGRPEARFVDEHSADPVWSPDGKVVVYSGPDIGTTFPVKAVTADGRPYPLPKLTLSRGERHLCFMPGTRNLVVLRGEMGHKNLWLIDGESGAERQLTHFAPDFTVRDFDISPDGREIVVEQMREHSDVVMIELPRR
jgi:Tol biopolymer transport system component